MQRFFHLVLAVCCLTSTLLMDPLHGLAAGAAPEYKLPSGFVIGQFKITGDEYIVLQNNTATDITDLSSYWLYAFNKTNPNDAGTSSSGQQLPSGRLEAGETILLSSKARVTCGAAIAGDFSLSLGDSAGYIQLSKQTDAGGKLVQQTVDAVSWSSSTAGTITKVPSNTTLPAGVYYRSAQMPSGWQLAVLDPDDNCQLSAMISGATAVTAPPVSGLLVAVDEPPVTVLAAVAENDSGAVAATIPAADIGLQSPQITELLPNPTGTGNDETDEFIELYNPNDKAFDLSGFVLQTGLNTKRSYTFPAGSSILPRSYKAYFSAETGLSLSNSSSAATLLDPLSNEIGHSDAYGTAKDGAVWARGRGNWQWSLEATPNAANIIKPPATKSAAKSKSTANKSGSTSKTISSAGKSSVTGSSSFANTANTDGLQVTPIHSWTLAAAGLLAVAYGIYEYRLDLANRFYRLRRHYADRRARRQAT